jgi:peptide/nickel transport system ATP-binding protein
MSDVTTARPEPAPAPTASEPVLQIDDLHTEFHLRRSTVRAVDGVSFEVRAGECVGLVGESGCGKSTLGLSVMKLLPSVGHVTSGSIRLEGRELATLREKEMEPIRGNEVAMIFQDPMTSLNPTWTIGKQIEESVRLHRGASKEEASARALEVLDLVGVPRPAERIDYYPHQLSGGLRQRVMIAIALACDPKLLIADEPTTALDVTIQAQILDLLDELRSRLHMAIVLITHDMGVIATRTDRVMVMYAGKIVESATTTELFSRMHHPYTQALLDAIPRLDQDRSVALFTIPGLPPDLAGELTGCRFAPRCGRATDQCRADEPVLGRGAGPISGEGGAADESGHVFACFHPVDGPIQHDLEGATSDSQPAPAYVRAGAAELTPTSSQPDSDVLVEVRNLVKEYPVTAGAILQRKLGSVKAVSDVSLQIRRGRTFGLVGESGCGKTTIGRLVVALERPTDGSIRFEGEDLATLGRGELRRRRRDLQLMFQDPYASLDPRMRVGAIIEEPLVIQGIGNGREHDRRVGELLGEVGLSPRSAELYPHEFSGGQRQRIGLARALALNPRLIVADEPVSALDVSIQAQIINLMRSLQDRHELTYLVISHDLAVVRYLADDIGVMYLGKLVETGSAKEVYERAAHPYTRGLIDTVAIPDPSLARRKSAAVPGELPSAIFPPSGCRFRTRCPLAQDICAEVEPQHRLFGDGHTAACHFPLQPPIEGGIPVGFGASN